MDIGAGSGILIEQAEMMGLEAVGVEPSAWLVRKAEKRGLQVLHGTVPHKNLSGKFNVVTLIDVIEHVDNPSLLIQDASRYLEKDGVLVIITPDVRSLAARLLGKRWWHFRIAHIGYFSKPSLLRLAAQADLTLLAAYRPLWFFRMSYLVERLGYYIPGVSKLKKLSILSKLIVPINLGDSLMFVLRRKRN